MKITLHIGAHHTRTPRLVKCVGLSARAFKRHGIFAPKPSQYRPQISALLSKLDKLPPIMDEENDLLKSIMGSSKSDHLVMINADWSSKRDWIFQGGGLHNRIGENVARVTELFSGHEVRLSMAIRNPAYILNASYTSKKPPKSLEWLLKNHDSTSLNWRDPIEALQAAIPEVPILMWCEEDSLLIWARVIREFGGLEPGTPVRGTLAAVKDALQPEGFDRLRAFLSAQKPKNAKQYERIVLAFLDKYADESIMKQVCHIPDWTAETVHKVSQRYNDDVNYLSQKDGIKFILPEV